MFYYEVYVIDEGLGLGVIFFLFFCKVLYGSVGSFFVFRLFVLVFFKGVRFEEKSYMFIFL